MTLLAIDSSTHVGGLALYDGHRVLYECAWTRPDMRGADLAPGIQAAFKRTGLKLNDVNAIAIAIGPGSYTGLRTSLALAKGMVLARGLDLIAVPTLDILAAGQPLQEKPLAAVLQAGRGRLAVGWYREKKNRWQAEGKAALMTTAELEEAINKPTLICGELNEEDRRTLGRKYKNAELASPAQCVRRPAVLAELAWARWDAGDTDDIKGLSPIYLQAGQAVPA
ncbi:MAG: tRNA (adenosine(37)-N6)-threonylcarbamoyltransferase complex dimerization subunit type 1 TsaB [Chloroflexi bacterium]|nr:tRNA (adenosine(37)-N6)-threonylcarbamoyltransferase complex dimerization subunit type 1 TsaB [Chloroflexota bacterium]